MNQNTNQILFALLRSAISGNQLEEKEKELYSNELLPNLLALAKRHDIAHLLALGLVSNGLLSKDMNDIENEIIIAVYRYEQLHYEYEKLYNAFETAKIPFIPLKGLVLRKYYPKPWMRSSCDIDILIRDTDIKNSVDFLVNNFGYICKAKGAHDVSLFSPNQVHIELHYDLIEDGRANTSSDVLKDVWNTAVLNNGYNYLYEMPDDMFYFYHIAHMAKHFEIGGCGIRPFIDLWILDNINQANKNKRDELLRQGGLLQFAGVAQQLSRVWLANEEHNYLTRQMEQYILRGGVYGSADNYVLIQQQKKGGKIKYFLSRIFLPYSTIKFQYPILNKYPILTPLYEAVRWVNLLLCGSGKKAIYEFKRNGDITKTESENMQIFLNNIGL